MIELTVAELRTDDVGRRVIVLHDGVTAEGVVEEIWARWSKYAKPNPGPRTRLTVTADSAKVEITDLPGDFLLQVDRPVTTLAEDVERCRMCGCELAYPTARHVLDCHPGRSTAPTEGADQ